MTQCIFSLPNGTESFGGSVLSKEAVASLVGQRTVLMDRTAIGTESPVGGATITEAHLTPRAVVITVEVDADAPLQAMHGDRHLSVVLDLPEEGS